MAVVRIEMDHSRPPKLGPRKASEAASEIAVLSGLPRVSAIQVDFDALESERAFYALLLGDLRRRPPF
jgi:hypothetical protein